VIYHIESATYPWLGGIGFLAGVPAARLVLRARPSGRTRPRDLDGVAAAVRRATKNQPVQWLALGGDESAPDNDLLLRFRLLGMAVHIETRGARSMCDHTGRLPIWEHVCLRPVLPIAKVYAELFHSVAISGAATYGEARDFSAYLDKFYSYNGRRYIVVDGPGEAAAGANLAVKLGRPWSLTTPLHPVKRGGH